MMSGTTWSRGLVAGVLLLAGAHRAASQPGNVEVDAGGNVHGPKQPPREILLRFSDDSLVGAIAEELFQRGQSFESITGDSGLDTLFRRFGARTLVRRFGPDRPRTLATGRISRTVARRVRDEQSRRAVARWDKLRQRWPGRATRGAPKHRARAGAANIYSLLLGDTGDVSSACRALTRAPDVAYAEPNRRVSVCLAPDDPYYSSVGSWGQADLDDLWGLKQIDMSAAWDSASGAGVTIAVVDTGVDYVHEDISANMWQNADEIPGNGIDDDDNGYVDDVYGYDFANSDGDPADDCGHGTHVAGTAAAVADNGVGIAGVAFGARIMAVKGLNQYGEGDSIALYSAIRYAVDNGAHIINNSWGGAGSSLAVQDAVEYALAAGCVVVCSAGNNGQDARYFFPGNIDGAIVVGAATYNGSYTPPVRAATYSNDGGKVDVYAPGGQNSVGILSLLADGSYYQTSKATCVVGGKYLWLTGTSMATPHVSGAVALLLEQSPALTVEQIRHVLRSTATDLVWTGWDYYSSFGFVDVAAALAAPAPAELTATITAPAYWLAAPDNFIGKGVREVRGTAAGVDFDHYEIASAFYEQFNPFSFQPIYQGNTAVQDGVLASIDTSTWSTGEYFLRLRVIDTQGRAMDAITRLCVDASLADGWPQLAASSWKSLPVGARHVNIEDQTLTFADLDGDGQKEVIAVDAKTLYVWRHDAGAFDPAFPKYISEVRDLPSAPAVADLDNDGDLEIVLFAEVDPTGQPIYAFHHDGTAVAGFPTGNPDPSIPAYVLRLSGIHSPAITDLDGDGEADIVFACGTYNTNYSYTYLSVVAATGTVRPGWPAIVSCGGDLASAHYEPRTSVAVADLDGDGTKEIILGRTYDVEQAGLGVYGADGQLQRDVVLETGTRGIRHPLVGDWNRDGSKEIAALTNHMNPDSSLARYAHLVDALGNELPGWPVATGCCDITDSAILCDIDADAELELVFIGGMARRYVYSLNLDGTPTALNPIYVNNYNSGMGFSWCPLTVAWVDATAGGVGFCSGSDLLGFYGYGASGDGWPGWPKPIPGTRGAPAIADLEGDGDMELGLRAYDGLVYLFREACSLEEALASEWPTLHGGNRRTAVPSLSGVSVAPGYPTALTAGQSENVGIAWEFLPSSALYRLRLELVDTATGDAVYGSQTLEDFGETGSATLSLPVAIAAPEGDAYCLRIRCERQENGSVLSEQSTSADIEVLADANRAPIAEDQLFAVNENTANGTPVGSIAASDPDTGDSLSFAATGGTGATAFAVAADTGEIMVADSAQLDFESIQSFTLGIQVTDTGGLTDTALVTIDLNDVNEPPVFLADPLVEADAEESVCYTGTIADDATDPDEGETLMFAKLDGPMWLTVDVDGALSGTPSASDAGLNRFSVQVDDGRGGMDQTTLEISVALGPVEDLGQADLPGEGTVSGSYTDTHASDDTCEAITEVESGGKPKNRYSYLEHEWTVSVTGGTAVTFMVEAHRTASSDGDSFVFAYSCDGASFTDMLTVTKTIDDDSVQTYVLPASTAGTLYIRVRDTDRTSGNRALDTVYVDRLMVLSDGVSADPPEIAIAPSPADGATDVSTGVSLTWTAGRGASSFDVYFGTNPAPGAAEFRGNQSGTSFAPGTLAPETTYHWRVDGTNAYGTTTGAVWSFTTGTSATEMFVQDIAMGSRKAGKNYFGQATVTVRDTSGGYVDGAAVHGAWSGSVSGTASGSTQADGTVLIESGAHRNGGTFTFTVTNVEKAGATYDPALNVETSDSIVAP